MKILISYIPILILVCCLSMFSCNAMTQEARINQLVDAVSMGDVAAVRQALNSSLDYEADIRAPFVLDEDAVRKSVILAITRALKRNDWQKIEMYLDIIPFNCLPAKTQNLIREFIQHRELHGTSTRRTLYS